MTRQVGAGRGKGLEAEVVDLVATVERCGRQRPDQVAVATATEALTYRDLLSRAGEQASRKQSHPERAALAAADAIEVAVALVASAMVDGALLMVDPAAPAAEAERARARFGGSAGTALPSGLGLSTSGVTSEPRCVVRPWPLVASNAAAFAEGLGLSPEDVVMTTSSMHHSYAVSAGLCGSLAAGASFVAPGGLVSPAVLARHIVAHRVSVLLSVPVLYRWYTAGIDVAQPPRLCVSAGAPLGDEIRKAWDEAVGWPLAEHYGTSELGQLTVSAPGEPGTVGRPLPGVEVRAIKNAASGEHELQAAVAGPPSHLLENLDGAVTARALTGWVPTGDLGTVDAGGRVWIHGRHGDVVNIGGKKVALTEVEALLRSLPGARDAAVIACGDGDVLPKLHGFVEAGADFSVPDAVAALRRQLAPYKVPRQLLRLSSLPRTGSGKVRRHELGLLTGRGITVPFHGTGAGDSPLTWGGRAIRHSIEWLGEEARYFNDCHVLPLPEGVTVDDVTAGLSALVSRHQALRAYYPQAGGETVVRVAGEGTLPVAVHQAPRGTDPRELAEDLAEQYGRPLFTSEEMPLRCAIVLSAGLPSFAVLVLSHQSIDAWAVRIILSELQLLWRGQQAELARPVWQLLDQAADEATGECRRRGEASLRYWRAFYGTADAALFDATRRQPDPKPVRSVTMSSPCTQASAEVSAARLKVSTAAVLAGIVAVVLGHLTCHERVTLLLIAANRFDRRRRELVGPLVQDVLCQIDLGDTVDAVIQETAAKALTAYSNACYDPAAELRARREAELARGLCFDFHAAIVNDVRLQGTRPPGPGTRTSQEALSLLRAVTRFEPGGSWDRQNTKFFVRVTQSQGDCRIELMADTHYLTVTDMRQVLTAIEAIALAAATGTVKLSEVTGLCNTPPLARDGRWTRHQAGWVDVDALTGLLRGLACVQAAAVASDGEGGPLTAYVHPAGTLAPQELHRAVVGALRDSTVAIAPDRYVICASAPTDVDAVAAWASCAVVAAGDGRPSDSRAGVA